MKLKEHYGIDVPVSTIRALTEKHGEAMWAKQKSGSAWPEHPGVPVLIAEMDGSMVPVVETAAPGAGEAPQDRRKTRQLSWKEARLCLVQNPSSVTPIFGATMGSVEEAGERLWECALAAGAGNQTKIHGLGDAAPWIIDQVEERFGTLATYLIDFSHLSDYLAAAAEVVAGKNKDAWRKEKQDGLKANRWPEVVGSLQPFVEAASVPDSEAPVRACYRYLVNHSNYLDYQGARAAGLPIGSGAIESAHRYVMQSRLKIAGAGWKVENLEKMLALRVLRANGGWDDYWREVLDEAA